MSSSFHLLNEAAVPNLVEGPRPALDLSEHRVRFLARATEQLMGSLDLDTTARTAARLSVPGLSDACVVELLGSDGRLAQVARTDALPLGDALPTVHPEHLLVVPLEARGRQLGALRLSTAASGRRYGPADRVLAEDFAARTALALDNALLHQRLEDALRQRDDFLLTAAHDLNTPLAVLKLQAQTLLRGSRGGHVDDTIRKRAEAIDRQVHQLSHMVSNLLHASRLSAAGLELSPEPMDLCVLVREVVARLEAQAVWVGSPITLEAPASVPGRWDRVRLDEVLSNLISNALKYGAGKPVTVRVEQVGRRARVEVRDEGIGIAPERLARIWEKFGRAVEGGARYPGFGLGLWIVKRLVEAAGGTVAVESQPGRGSTFTVELPLPAPAPDDRAEPPARPNEDAPT